MIKKAGVVVALLGAAWLIRARPPEKTTVIFKGVNPEGFVTVAPVRPVVLGLIPESPAAGKGLTRGEVMLCDWLPTEIEGRRGLKLKCGERTFLVAAVGRGEEAW